MQYKCCSSCLLTGTRKVALYPPYCPPLLVFQFPAGIAKAVGQGRDLGWIPLNCCHCDLIQKPACQVRTNMKSKKVSPLVKDEFTEVQTQIHEGSKLVHEPSNQSYPSIQPIT